MKNTYYNVVLTNGQTGESEIFIKCEMRQKADYEARKIKDIQNWACICGRIEDEHKDLFYNSYFGIMPKNVLVVREVVKSGQNEN